MIVNYFKIAWRNLVKYPLFSFINIVGLGMAIPFALMALMQLQSSFEFDNFHTNSARIYRIVSTKTSADGIEKRFASTPFQLIEKIRADYPTIENATHVVREFGWELNNRVKSDEVNTIFVEKNFFEIFNFPLESGTWPIEPNSLVLSHEKAEWFFNGRNVVGQLLTHPTYGSFKIVGVLKPFKPKTQFKSDVMVSMATYKKFHPAYTNPDAWAELPAHTFIKILPQTQAATLTTNFQLLATAINKQLATTKTHIDFRLQPFEKISPSTDKLAFDPYVEDMLDVAFNFSIPLMILLLAGFNYTNLTLARSLSRSREVGVRKLLGAFRSQLLWQFLFEAIIISFIALGLGMVLLFVMKQNLHVPWITWEVDNEWIIYLIFIAFALVLGLVSGILPAWILSGFQPIKVLKGTISPATFGKIGFRKSLIVIQFVVTLLFIFQIGHLYNQFRYMATENENFNRKGIYNLQLSKAADTRLENEILKNKHTEQVGYVSQTFGNVPAYSTIRPQKASENIPTFYYAADRGFFDNMHLAFLAGKPYEKNMTDSASRFVVVNEKAIEKLNLGRPHDALGMQIWLGNNQLVEIAGVVKNFCHYNYQFDIEPIVFQYNPAQFTVMSIQTDATTDATVFEHDLKKIWKSAYPFDEMGGEWYAKALYERYYPAEDMKVMGVTSLIIFIIAIMGLLGMLTYTTEKRVKEIGIRKVMGAEIPQIVLLMAWGFVKLLLIASLIAIPIGIGAGQLLNSFFTYNNGISYGLMAVYFMVVMAIAFSAVGIYAFRAAIANPVNSLRSE